MKYFRAITALLLPLLFAACEFEETDLGFPKTVTFTNEGGEMIVTSEKGEYFTHAEIHDYKSGDNGATTTLEDGRECNTYKWLKVEYQRNSNDIKILAEPNEKQSRTLYIELYSGPQYHVIKVVQKGSN